MASKKEKQVSVKALVNICYDKDFYKINEEFKVRISDAQEMNDRGYVELMEESPIDVEDQEEVIEEGE